VKGEGKRKGSGPARPQPDALAAGTQPAGGAPGSPARPSPGQETSGSPAHDWQEGLDVKIKTRPKHGGTLRMNGWLAGLRDGGSARPADPGAEPYDPGPSGSGNARSASYADPVPAARGAASPSNRNPGRAGRGYAPLSQAELEWHHDYQADEAYPRWQISEKPSRYIHSPAVASNPSRA
jgi:hypothetical protein